MFAAASRALKGYNDELAERALTQSKRLLKEGTELMSQQSRAGVMEMDFSWIDGFMGRNMNIKPDKQRQKLMERSRRKREQLGDMATNLIPISLHCHHGSPIPRLTVS